MRHKQTFLTKLGWTGLGKIAIDRFRVYVSYIQLYMILNLYLKAEAIEWYRLLFLPYNLIILFAMLAIYFDIAYIYRGEQQAAFDVHPYLPAMRDNIEKIGKEIEDLKKEIESLNDKLENFYAAQNKDSYPAEA